MNTRWFRSMQLNSAVRIPVNQFYILKRHQLPKISFACGFSFLLFLTGDACLKWKPSSKAFLANTFCGKHTVHLLQDLSKYVYTNVGSPEGTLIIDVILSGMANVGITGQLYVKPCADVSKFSLA